MKKRTDYDSALESCAGTGLFQIGREVVTGEGKGIIVASEMPYNGLYVSPERTRYVVWFGVDKSVGEEIGYTNMSYSHEELLSYNPDPKTNV